MKKVKIVFSNAGEGKFEDEFRYSCNLNVLNEYIDSWGMHDVAHDANYENKEEDSRCDEWRSIVGILEDEGVTELNMIEQVSWRWTDGSAIMTRDDYDAFDWDNNEEYKRGRLRNCFEQGTFNESNSDAALTYTFTNLHEDVVKKINEQKLYDCVKTLVTVDSDVSNSNYDMNHVIESEWDE